MTDSDELDEKHERNREQRERAVERWVEYIETHDVAVWGPQQNRLVDSQLESARQSDIDIEHRQRVAQAQRHNSSKEE